MQTQLFHNSNATLITIGEASAKFLVSEATIRNWIKSGQLKQVLQGSISMESFNHFENEMIGKVKLKSRANKAFKDNHDHQSATEELQLLLNANDIETAGAAYEETLSNAYKNKEGIYYTPEYIIADMFKGIVLTSKMTFLDPCCGSGNFIIQAIENGIDPANVYGYDTDENAVKITLERIKRRYGVTSSNIKVGDFMHECAQLTQKEKTFDLIATNPPWGKKINKVNRDLFALQLDAGKANDTSALFMLASLQLLKPCGVMSFLVQDAFFNIAVYSSVRTKLLGHTIKYITDYGKPFKGVMSKACAITVVKQSPQPNDVIACGLATNSFVRSYQSLLRNPKSILNYWTDEREAQIITHLYQKKHLTLKGNAKWGLGIVTGDNARYCSTNQNVDSIPIFKGSDITKSGIKTGATYIDGDFGNCQQVAPMEFYLAKEKIIYKFISSEIICAYDDQQRLVLNSANLLIPSEIGITMPQLVSLLNSDIINWLFKKLFNTFKVLRHDLETLPIHTEYFREYAEFSESTYLNFLGLKQKSDGSYSIIGKN